MTVVFDLVVFEEVVMEDPTPMRVGDTGRVGLLHFESPTN
jgi:hypothetical protein